MTKVSGLEMHVTGHGPGLVTVTVTVPLNGPGTSAARIVVCRSVELLSVVLKCLLPRDQSSLAPVAKPTPWAARVNVRWIAAFGLMLNRIGVTWLVLVVPYNRNNRPGPSVGKHWLRAVQSLQPVK